MKKYKGLSIGPPCVSRAQSGAPRCNLLPLRLFYHREAGVHLTVTLRSPSALESSKAFRGVRIVAKLLSISLARAGVQGGWPEPQLPGPGWSFITGGVWILAPAHVAGGSRGHDAQLGTLC